MKDEKTNWLAYAMAFIGGVSIVVGLFVLGVFLVQVLWAWTIPPLFPGAVKEGLIVSSISWYVALRVCLFAWVLLWIVRGFGIGQKDK